MIMQKTMKYIGLTLLGVVFVTFFAAVRAGIGAIAGV